ncbi:DNA binding [Blomia tropicalis]|nr:DNA binding [Blomia tropicalis]
MEEERDLLWEEFINSLNNCPSDIVSERDCISEPQSKPTDNESNLLYDGDDPNDPDYNLIKDLEEIGFDDDLDLNEYSCLNHNNNENNVQEVDQPNNNNNVNESATSDNFTIEQLTILRDQLRFHVQTLVQTWMLSSTNQEVEHLSFQSMQMLLELKSNPVIKSNLNCLNPSSSSSSSLVVDNLDSSIALIDQHGDEIIKSEKRSSIDLISEYNRKLIVSRPDIFPYKWAFPNKRCKTNCSSIKCNFSFAEDFLFAIGLYENCKSGRVTNSTLNLIEKNYVHSKSVSSLSYHYKHMKRNLSKIKSIDIEKLKQKENYLTTELAMNPIICYLRGDVKLPKIRSYFEDSTADDYMNYKRAPKWLKVNVDKDENELQIVERKVSNEKQRSKSRSIVPKGVMILDPNTPIGAIPFGSLNVQPPSPSLSRIKIRQLKVPNKPINHQTLSDILFKKSQSSNRQQKRLKSNHPNEKDVTKDQSINVQNEHLGEFGVVASDNNESEFVTNINSIPESKVTNEENLIVESIEQSDTSQNCNNTNSSSWLLEPQPEEDDNEVDNGYVPSNCEEFVDDDDIVEGVDDENDDDGESVDEESDIISSNKDDRNNDDDDAVDECNLIDNENDLMALMEASWTTVTNRSRHSNLTANGQSIPSNCFKRKSEILARQRDSSLFILQHELSNDHSKEDNERKELFADYYLKLAQKTLTNEHYVKFLQLLSNFWKNSTNDMSSDLNRIKEVYGEIKKFLIELMPSYTEAESTGNDSEKTRKGISELVQLLVLFLDLRQSQECGEAFEYLYLNRVFDFIRKVEIYLSYIYTKRSQKLACIQRLIKSIKQINQQQNELEEKEVKLKAKTVVSKILNGHRLLVEEFSSLFTDNPPARYLFTNDDQFEEITINDDDVDGDHFENVSMPIEDRDLKYGTKECPCKHCHSTSEQNTEPLTQTGQSSHCDSCSIRFIAGRIYLPQYNSCNKKEQLIEYVRHDEKSEASAIGHNQSGNNHDQQWTMAEDRMLLEACRSIIVDSQINQLDQHVFDNVAQQLVDRFDSRRTIDQLSKRLRHLIDMLNNANEK